MVDDFDKDSLYFVFFRYIGRPLGYRFAEGTGPIWLDELACAGTETHLFNCLHNGWGVHNCDHSEDVGLSCSSNASGIFPSTLNSQLSLNIFIQVSQICTRLYDTIFVRFVVTDTKRQLSLL